MEQLGKEEGFGSPSIGVRVVETRISFSTSRITTIEARRLIRPSRGDAIEKRLIHGREAEATEALIHVDTYSS